jgi:hypothetical protein
MRGTTRTLLLSYGGAVVFAASAVLLRWLLDPWPGGYRPFPTLYGAVALTGWARRTTSGARSRRDSITTWSSRLTRRLCNPFWPPCSLPECQPAPAQ